MLGWRREPARPRLDQESRPELRAFAYEQAELHRDGVVTRQAALAAIRERFPELSAGQAESAFARGLQDSR